MINWTPGQKVSGIFEFLNFTWDTPDKNSNKKMPVLDCQLWLGVQRREKGIPHGICQSAPKVTQVGSLKVIILFEFYKKPMANKRPNLQRAALPESSKVSTAVNECIRRFKNTSRDLPDSNIEDILKEYMRELRHGGYSHN